MSPAADSLDPAAPFKEAAALQAVTLIRSGMRVGLGTGSTAIFATRRIAALLRSGELRDILAVATSAATAEAARDLGIPLLDDELNVELDVTIDGADEVDPDMNLIKGGSAGALLREKIVAQASRREVIVVDASKPSPRLGTRSPVPVEVITFGWVSQARFLQSLGASVTLRRNADGTPFATDSSHRILDAHFGPIADAAGLAAALNGRAGIVEHGLFVGLATDLIVAGADGIHHRVRPA
jgi:ribose 5-phosphate isomerase A